MIYQPAEDSYLLEDVVKNFLKNKDKNIEILDMGSGSGIQAQACVDLGFDNVLAVDVNPDAVKNLDKKGLNVVESDLFSNIDENEKYDLIIFNAPYLPEDKREPEDIRLATTAGKEGYEIIVKFLEESKDYLNEKGKILLLFSSLSQPEIILNKSQEFGYEYKLIKKMKLDFEELLVYEFKKE